MNRRQLLALGATDEAIKAARRTGRLINDPRWRGVYAVGHVTQTTQARLIAAVLSCGPDAVLSHASAAINFGLLADRPAAAVDVSSMTWRAATAARRLHRLRHPLDDADRCIRHSIPSTTVPRLILDLAETAPTADVEHVLNEAHFSFGLRLEAVHRAAQRAPGRHGRAQVAALLARYDDGTSWTHSRLERTLTQLIVASGLPPASMNHPFGRYRIDAAWPQIRLAVEVDGRAAHSTPANFERDRLKQNALTLAGWVVLRFTFRQLLNDSERVVERIRAAGRACAGILLQHGAPPADEWES